jgi:hypothetical protein
MRKNLFYLATLALSVAFTGCSSDEPVATGNGGSTSTPKGTPIVFNAVKNIDPAKKVIYGATYTDLGDDNVVGGEGADADRVLTPLYWTIGDDVKIWSEHSATPNTAITYTSDATVPIFAAGDDKPDGAGLIVAHQSTGLTTEGPGLTWDKSSMTFKAFYPADLIEVNTDGTYEYTIDDEQDGSMTNALMYAEETETEGNNVTLNFHEFTTTIELTIPTNTTTIASIGITTYNGDAVALPLAGTFSSVVSPTPVDGTGSDKVTITPPADFTSGTLYAVLAPQAFTNLYIRFTDTEGNHDTKVYSGAITPGSLYRFTVGDFNWIPADREDMGSIADLDNNGTPDGNLYFAVGNLIAEYSSVPETGTNTAPDNGYYIAGTEPGKSQYTANSDYSTTTFLNTERDLFKVGDISHASYWVNNTSYPTITNSSTDDSYTSGQTFSGDAGCDLVRDALDSPWRLPTEKEWTALTNTANYTWEWKTNYNSVSGLNGYEVKCKANGNSIFLPATGNRIGTSVNGRGTSGLYWSGTLDSNDAYDAYGLDFSSGYWNTYNLYRFLGFALRPVSSSPSE